MPSAGDLRARWLTHLLSTDAADRPVAESSVQALYMAAGFAPPQHVLWFDSPLAASAAVALLIESQQPVWRNLLGSVRQRRGEREQLERASAQLCASVGAGTLEAVRAAVGAPLGMSLQYMGVAAGLLHPAVIGARMALRDDVSALFSAPTDADELFRAEQRYLGSNLGVLISPLHCSITGPLIGQSFLADYPFWMMANDEAAVADHDAPAVLRAAWTVARTSGPWWPFAHAALMTEHPSELYTNAQALLHREDGPALVYRDGAKAYAWNGRAVPEDWIMRPEAVAPAKFRGFDPTFRKWVEGRTAGRTAKTKGAKTPAAGIVDAELPPNPDDRVRALRAHASGALPRFDRYVAGEHEAVWAELVALGPRVREDPEAADALAVAYETMRRVELNVRTVIERLRGIGYLFLPQEKGVSSWISRMRCGRDDSAHAHVSPTARARAQRVSLEKSVGALPLSLRAFYEVVGAVNLIGEHPTVAPPAGAIATDPLVVYGLDDALQQVDAMDAEERDAIWIAPDDLHKAGTSGGDPYAIAVPDLRADGELLDERHNLLFVQYLRLCFRFGGFPGYDGQEDLPREIDQLSVDLVPF
jgi:hypothetical protein